MSILSGGNLLGWFNFEDIFKFANNIDSAIYCFGVFEKVPKKHELPFTLKEVLYVGQTGGQEKTWDRKDKNTGRGMLQTTFKCRMKNHSSNKIKNIKKGLKPNELVCVYIITPKKFMEETMIKTWLLQSESEMITNYSYIHGDVPEHNKAHKSKSSNKNSNSVSQIETRKIMENSLVRFI
jgi:hypothetical protein